MLATKTIWSKTALSLACCFTLMTAQPGTLVAQGAPTSCFVFQYRDNANSAWRTSSQYVTQSEALSDARQYCQWGKQVNGIYNLCSRQWVQSNICQGGGPEKPKPEGPKTPGGENDCALRSVMYYRVSFSGPTSGNYGFYCCRNYAERVKANLQRQYPRYSFTVTGLEYRTYIGGSKCQSKNTIQCVNGQVMQVPFNGTIYNWGCN